MSPARRAPSAEKIQLAEGKEVSVGKIFLVDSKEFLIKCFIWNLKDMLRIDARIAYKAEEKVMQSREEEHQL